MATYYQIQYTRKKDPSGTWYNKPGYFYTKQQAEFYADRLSLFSDIYKELHVVPVEVQEKEIKIDSLPIA